MHNIPFACKTDSSTFHAQSVWSKVAKGISETIFQIFLHANGIWFCCQTASVAWAICWWLLRKLRTQAAYTSCTWACLPSCTCTQLRTLTGKYVHVKKQCALSCTCLHASCLVTHSPTEACTSRNQPYAAACSWLLSTSYVLSVRDSWLLLLAGGWTSCTPCNAEAD